MQNKDRLSHTADTATHTSANKPKVSVCTITYNHAEYIRDCIEGVLMQKTDFPFEFIIHDDASTDGTAEIVQEYAERHPNIIKPILQTDNKFKYGGSIYSQYVFPLAKGEYIALCEGDDYWTDPLKLQKQIHFLESNQEYSIVGHNAFVLTDSNKDRIRLFTNTTQTETIDITPSELIKSWVFPTASIIIRRFDTQIAEEFLSILTGGDIKIILTASLRGKVAFMPLIGSVYRQNFHSNSETSKTTKRKGSDLLTQKNNLYRKYYELSLKKLSPTETAEIKKEIHLCEKRTNCLKTLERVPKLHSIISALKKKHKIAH